mmetsp:Transcript_2696/g.5039  ORF Transcript_2696/g.5039 Transcript_2696/m.5039 type:complete len:486 (+) Transcript_2696:109-1566(+)
MYLLHHHHHHPITLTRISSTNTTSTTNQIMSLVTFTIGADAELASVEDICDALARQQQYVVGYIPPNQRQYGKGEQGGVFLSMVHLTLPWSVLDTIDKGKDENEEMVVVVVVGEDDMDCSTSTLHYWKTPPNISLENSDMIPKKFTKLLKRELLHYKRWISMAQGSVGNSSTATTMSKMEVVDFRGLKLYIGRGELVPRPSSGILVEEVMKHLIKLVDSSSSLSTVRILDLGCGCGALLLATMKEFMLKRGYDAGYDCIGVGMDLDANALEWARQNAHVVMNRNVTTGGADADPDPDADTRNISCREEEDPYEMVKTLSCGVPWVDTPRSSSSYSSFSSSTSRAQVAFLQADFGSLHTLPIRSALPPQGFHVILCNPPYLPRTTNKKSSSTTTTRGRITVEEDRALYAGDDGNDAYRALASSLSLCNPFLLASRGVLCVQLPGACSIHRRKCIAEIFRKAHCGWDAYEAPPDQRGIVRCLLVINQ